MTQNVRKTVGVMGGMGPDATVDFMAKVIALADSADDQDHVHLIVDQDPGIPNRTVAILEGSSEVTRALGEMAERLEKAGADFLVMVCNTAHFFLDDVYARTAIPFVSIIEESVSEVERLAPDAKTVGIMATEGCLRTGMYQDAITATGRQAVAPEGDELRELMRLIGAIKAGNKGDDVAAAMRASASELLDKGAELIIAGCTEIPIVFEGDNFPVPVVASTNVLAVRAVEFARGLKPLPHKR